MSRDYVAALNQPRLIAEQRAQCGGKPVPQHGCVWFVPKTAYTILAAYNADAWPYNGHHGAGPLAGLAPK